MPEDGYLILQGGGPAVPPILKDYLSYTGGEATNAVLIPTASEETAELAPDRQAHLQERFRYFLGISNVSVLHTLDRKRADSEEFPAPIRQATLVWIMGGDDQLLADTCHGTRTEREIRAVLSRGGIVGGSSGGRTYLAHLYLRILRARRRLRSMIWHTTYCRWDSTSSISPR